LNYFSSSLEEHRTFIAALYLTRVVVVLLTSRRVIPQAAISSMISLGAPSTRTLRIPLQDVGDVGVGYTYRGVSNLLTPPPSDAGFISFLPCLFPRFLNGDFFLATTRPECRLMNTSRLLIMLFVRC